MAKRVSPDRTLFAVTLFLVFIGLVFVFSASAVMAKEKMGSPYALLLRQFIGAAGGLVAMFVLMHTDYRKLRHPAVVFSVMGITTLLLVVVLFADKTNNAHRWLRLGALSFQPSELAKPALVLFLAYFLETRLRQLDDWRRVLLPAIVPTVVFAALILRQPDLGTALACLFITATLLFVAGVRLRYFIAPALALIPMFYFFVIRVPWRYQRILAFLDPWSDPLGRGFHIIQSLIAVGTGGVTGVGLMEGKQKLFYLPEPHSDFIFAVAAEETGLLGVTILLALFAVFFCRGFRASLRAPDDFARFLATGITAMVVVQALLNISVVLGLVPTKGIPLPFISYGGSSLFVTLASVGVLLNITQQTD
jgi:cell division protein FtsW